MDEKDGNAYINENDDKLKGLTPNEYRMATENVRKLVLNYSIPTIIGMLVNALYNVVDRFWVGKIPGVGTAALTGLGLCMPVMNILMGVAQLVGIGAAAGISIRIGRKDREAAEEILGNAFSLSLCFSVLITIFGLVFSPQILQLLGADDEITVQALPYLRIVLSGCVFSITSFCMNHPIRATGNPKRFASTQLLGGIINIVLDPILIFGLQMGVAGAALATIIAQFASAAWVFSYYFKKDAALKLRIKNMMPKWKTAMVIFSIGLSPFLMQVLNSFLSIVMNLSLKHYGNLEMGNGNIAIGAMTVIGSVSTIFFMPIFGINQGTQPIQGFNYGAKNYKRLKDAYLWSVIYSSVIMCVGFITIQLLASQLVQLFNNDPHLIQIGKTGMRIYLFMMPVLGFVIPSNNFFTAIGRAKISIFLSMLRQVLLLIPAILILPMAFGLKGIWYAGPTADAFSAVITIVFIVREFKVLRQKLGISQEG